MMAALARALAALWERMNNTPGMPVKPVAAPVQAPVSSPKIPPKLFPDLGGTTPTTPASAWSCLLPYEYDDAANISWYGNFDWQKEFIGTDQSRYLGRVIGQDGDITLYEWADKLSDTNKKYEERALKPRSLGWDHWLGDQMARAVKSGKTYIEFDNADYALERDRSVVVETYRLANGRGLAVVLKNPTAQDISEFARLNLAGAVFESGALSPLEFAGARKSVVPTLQATWVRHGGSINGGDIREIAVQVRSVPGTSVQWGPLEYQQMRLVESNPLMAGAPAPMPAPAPQPAPPAPPAPPVPAPAPDLSVPNAAEYLARWQAMTILPSRTTEASAIARRLTGYKPRYQAVEAKTGVPWYLIAVLHERESGANFSTYLGNGEPLNRVTRLVPKGRGPFSSWEAGAIDALAVDGLSSIKSWPIERIAYSCEKYNGMGYRARGVPSPYLWSFSNIYKGGKYVADGVWSASAQDQQCGTMVALKAMAAIDATIPHIVTPEPPKPPPVPGVPELRDLGHRIKRTMQAKGFPWFVDQNVVSVEGMDPDGKVNANRPNAFDDIKMVIDGEGRIIGGPWEATTQPGKFWTEHPMAAGGAFIISLGPQSVWSPGLYHDKTVWRQAEDSTILGTRDPNVTYKRQGAPVRHGNIGVHHHGGYNLPHDNISNAAAGCQVVRLVNRQEEFMRLTMACPRYLADKRGYRMTATVLEAKDILL